MAVLRVAIHRSWLLLLIATGLTFWLRADGIVGLAAGAGTLAIAWYKGRLVILDFMELRDAPWTWRGIFEGWVLLVSAVILTIYGMGPI